jgi:hypothetical protein
VNKPQDQNQLLSTVTFITALGDQISFFAVLVLIHNLTGNTLLAAYTVPMKSLGVAIAGACFPSVASRISMRTVVIWTQILSFFLMGTIAWTANFSSYLALGIVLLLSILKQSFESAREHISKGLGEMPQQRRLQAQILHGLYSAQFLGPLLSFALIRLLPIVVPLWLDALTFLSAGLLALKLSPTVRVPESHSLLSPLSYLRKSPALLQIFFLRVLYWVPIGIFNYLIFVVIQDHFGARIENSAWIYSVIGLGSLIATASLRTGNLFHEISDTVLAAGALVLLAATRIAFLSVPALGWAMLVFAVGGICNGINAVATQSLRRKLTSSKQFPEIVGLELVSGKAVDWAVATLCSLAMARGFIGYTEGIWISAGTLVLLGMGHLVGKLRGV